MRIVIAPTAFKGTLTPREAADIMTVAAQAVFPDASIITLPLADGGEGTAEILIGATKGNSQTAIVSGPLPNQEVEARWGVLGDRTSAVFEISSTSGLKLVPPEKRNPKITTTFGAGELFRSILEAGYKNILVGLGDSGTNDGGAGIAQALGYQLLDSNGNEIIHGGLALSNLDRIDISNRNHLLQEAKIIAMCDVSNILLGPSGASHVYGPQKGTTEDDVKLLDEALAHYASVIRRDLGKAVADLPGSGAAGGAAAGLAAFCNATLKRGIDVVLDALDFYSLIADADFILTGEGKLDRQTFMGKTISGVAERAKKKSIPVLAIIGTSEQPPDEIAHAMDLHQIIRLIDITGEAEALRNPKNTLDSAARKLLKDFSK